MLRAVLAVYLFAIAFPFYAAINSLMYGLVKPLISYTMPCLAYLMYYRHERNRLKSVYPGGKWVHSYSRTRSGCLSLS